MRSFTVWAHPGFLDVVMYVVKIQYRGPTYFKAKVRWYTTRGTFLGEDVVKVQKDQLYKWKEVPNVNI